ncbi:MAG: DUF6449 domain-containing protein, partial [Bacillota bacterium]|nr:DUF6449 domain-containing protein [Bacillota bacterium]
APRGVGVFRIIAYLFFTAVLIAASAVLYKKRPSEAAGHAMAFRISMPIIKYPLLLLIGLGGGLFFKAASGGSCGWAIFGYISGIVLMHMVAQTIYYFDIKAVFRSLKPLAVFSALFAGLIMVAAFDLTGFDRKLPDAGDVDAVSVSFHRMYGLNKELGTINYDNLTGREKESLRRFTLRNSESIKSAVSLASLGISELDATHDRSTEEVGLVFKLRDGRELRRIYSVESDKALAYISRIYNTGEYKKKLFGAYSKKIFDATDLYIESPYFSSGDTAIASVKNPEKIKALYFSSVEELESLKAEELKDTGPNLIFRFSWSEKNESGEYTEVKNVCIPVYSNAPKTNALLSEYGIKIPDRISALQTDSIAININDPGSFYIGNNIVAERTAVSYGKENSIKITDKTEIATILPLVVPLEFERYNPFFEEDTGARVTIQSGSFMNGYSQEALFPKGKIPAFVIQMINEKLKLAS